MGTRVEGQNTNEPFRSSEGMEIVRKPVDLKGIRQLERQLVYSSRRPVVILACRVTL